PTSHPRAPHSFPTRRSSDLGDERGQELDGRRTPDDPLVVLRPRLKLFRGHVGGGLELGHVEVAKQVSLAVQNADVRPVELVRRADRKSTRLNSSHLVISYAV